MTTRSRWVRRMDSKRPVTVSGRPASSTDSRTWSDFKTASGSSAGVGLGFVLGDGIGCYDFDHCLTGGQLADWAGEAIRRFLSGSFSLRFRSLLRAFTSSLRLKKGRARKIRDGRNIERYTAGRHIAVTGRASSFRGIHCLILLGLVNVALRFGRRSRRAKLPVTLCT